MTPNEKIAEIARITGATPKKMAKGMGMSVESFYNKRNPKTTDENFKDENVSNLILFLEGDLENVKKIINQIKQNK